MHLVQQLRRVKNAGNPALIGHDNAVVSHRFGTLHGFGPECFSRGGDVGHQRFAVHQLGYGFMVESVHAHPACSLEEEAFAHDQSYGFIAAAADDDAFGLRMLEQYPQGFAAGKGWQNSRSLAEDRGQIGG